MWRPCPGAWVTYRGGRKMTQQWPIAPQLRVGTHAPLPHAGTLTGLIECKQLQLQWVLDCTRRVAGLVLSWFLSLDQLQKSPILWSSLRKLNGSGLCFSATGKEKSSASTPHSTTRKCGQLRSAVTEAGRSWEPGACLGGRERVFGWRSCCSGCFTLRVFSEYIKWKLWVYCAKGEWGGLWRKAAGPLAQKVRQLCPPPP